MFRILLALSAVTVCCLGNPAMMQANHSQTPTVSANVR
jgi:hypothetical protein